MVLKKLTIKEKKKLEKRELNRLDNEWREKVLERDGTTCAISGRTDYIHVHHILPREIRVFRHDVDNGLCLSPNNHKFSLENSPHRNPFSFMLWFMENRPEQFERLKEKYLEWKIN